MLSAKGLLALGAVVIAGTFVAVLWKARVEDRRERADSEALEKFGEVQAKRVAGEECHNAVKHAVGAAEDFLNSRYGDGASDAIREMAEHRCAHDGWSDDEIKCLERVASDNDLQRCISRLEDYQRRALEAEMKAFDARPRGGDDAGVDAADTYDFADDPFAVPESDPSPAPIAVDAQDAGDLPAECRRYQQLMEKVMVCDKLPQASRDALKQGLDAMRQSWGNFGQMQKDAINAMGEGCKQGSEALEQVGKQLCGW